MSLARVRLWSIALSTVIGWWNAFTMMQYDHISIHTREILLCPSILIQVIIEDALRKVSPNGALNGIVISLGNGLLYGAICYELWRVFQPREPVTHAGRGRDAT
jgi:hypothetical protein